jgi:hypothetical protein
VIRAEVQTLMRELLSRIVREEVGSYLEQVPGPKRRA